MSLSLPGNYLYSLSQDNLPPEEYERIISPNTALSRINREYEFDDRHNTGRYIINMRERQISSNQALPCGIREKEKLEKMVSFGDIVMLSDLYGPAKLFYINEEGKLICTNPLAFSLSGADSIIRTYNASVKRRDYQRIGGKPRPTKFPLKARSEQTDQFALKTRPPINRKAAGGVYNQNPEMFADTAKNLGGNAAKRFDQVLNEQTAGAMIATASILDFRRIPTMVNPINGRLPLNSKYAGKIYPRESLPIKIGKKYPHSVPFTKSGFPDFSRYSIKNVRIELGENRGVDFARADRAAGYSRKKPRPKDYTWHHHQDSGYMQLVPTDIHAAVKHTGGIATGK
ncbi:hypothetical protein B7R74_19875 [Yersinia pseudotuberculosis]|uniref:HNH endonuclease domain-containing protein n=4 Tax=Yersinia pseudotuberculosis complex TaxID=1649845 RepID=A0A380QD44_YERPU|nr:MULTISPECIES: HNH endonuclease [Yersinia pseudotuberculosis complex]PSH12860.1 hypothetical protein B7R74_19875 [Yersinia pseudotuberculosis]CRG52394.1 HNH endonuclease domain-containing protein [Yersinia wautersii]SUP85890.1 HNH endonuclease domain-containing protein [Yersinia pseudotuberculosis]